MWTTMFRHKYLKEKSFFEFKAKQGDSFVWRGIESCRSY